MALLWACTQTPEAHAPPQRVLLGNEVLIQDSLHLLRARRVALVANHTSMLPDGQVHLVDTLRKLGIAVRKVFAPEHGFRGGQQAGDTIHDHHDTRTGLPIVSLYGKKDRPSAEDLADVDVVVFDIQDVGTRYYTYLATMVWTMQVCAELGKDFVLLDRPNPNADRVGGPVATTVQGVITCLHAVPVLYGMTLGEYATMVNARGMLPKGLQARLRVVPMRNYRRTMSWSQTGLPWWPPSPNLPTPQSARYYPILCWYEGTIVSVGRGTESPFTRVGMPFLDSNAFVKPPAQRAGTQPLTQTLKMNYTTFCPMPIPGKADRPMHEGQLCIGYELSDDAASAPQLFAAGVHLLASMRQHYDGYAYYVHQQHPDSVVSFFNPYFERLVGGPGLRIAIEAHKPALDIVASWQPAIDSFLQVRQPYLRYPAE